MKAEEGFLLLLKGLSCKLLAFYFKGSAEEYRESGGKNNTLFTTPIYNIIFLTFCFSSSFVTISLLIFWKIMLNVKMSLWAHKIMP